MYYRINQIYYYSLYSTSVPNYYSIKVEPNSGLLKPGRKKYFKIIIESLGFPCVFQQIPLKCRISYFNTKVNLSDSNEPDGYFEYTDDGFYEKFPSNIPRDEYQFSINVNVNIRVLNSRRIDSAICYEEQIKLTANKESLEIIKKDKGLQYDQDLVDKILWDVIFCDSFKKLLENALLNGNKMQIT